MVSGGVIMIVTEFYMTRSDGVRLVRTYSDAGKLLERDGVLYEEAIDPEDSGRVYTESDVDVELSAEEALDILTGG